MAITTTEFDTFAKTAFYDNRNWLNQENWQMYFGGSLPSGVIVNGKLESDGVNYTSALSYNAYNASYIQFQPGSIMANGIFGVYEGGTYIPVVTSTEVDRLITARVYLKAGQVKIVGMTKVAAEYGYTPTIMAKMLLDDESLCCVRNDTYYDIPLCYEIFGGDIHDLRRLIYLPGEAPDVEINFLASEITNTSAVPGVLYGKYFLQAYGGMNYTVAFDENDASTYFYVDPVAICSEKPSVVKLINNSATTKEIRLPLLWKNLQYSYSWLENWDTDANSRYIYKSLVSEDKMVLILSPDSHETSFGYTVTNKSSASGMDPADYFTKQETAALLALKANESDMEADLALKADISDLGNLAYLDRVNYVTQITNKPALGALALKDKANMTSDVTGALPITNGGTGAGNAPLARKNLFDANLNDMARHLMAITSNYTDGGYLTLPLPVKHGGSGLASSPSMLTNLGTTNADTIMKAAPRPGVTGTLPIANGGTGLTASPSMLINLGSTSAANVLQASPRPGVTGILPVARGGTGTNKLFEILEAYVNQTVYVDGTNGNDTTGDGTSSAPYKTVTKALSVIVSTGTIIMTPNEYSGIAIYGKNITLVGATNGEMKFGASTITCSNVYFHGIFTISGLTCRNSNVHFKGVAATDYFTLTKSSGPKMYLYGGSFVAEQKDIFDSSWSTVRLISSGSSSYTGIENHGGYISLGQVLCNQIDHVFDCYGGVITHGTITGATSIGMKYAGTIISPDSL